MQTTVTQAWTRPGYDRSYRVLHGSSFFQVLEVKEKTFQKVHGEVTVQSLANFDRRITLDTPVFYFLHFFFCDKLNIADY